MMKDKMLTERDEIWKAESKIKSLSVNCIYESASNGLSDS